MDQDEREELLDTAVRAFHELRQRMSAQEAVRILVSILVLGDAEPPRRLTLEQAQRVQDVLDGMRLLDERSLRH